MVIEKHLHKNPCGVLIWAVFAMSLTLSSIAQATTGLTLRAVGPYEELEQTQFYVGVLTEERYRSSRDLLVSDQGKALEIWVVAEKLFARRFRRLWQDGAAINSSPREFRRFSEDILRFNLLLNRNLDRNDRLMITRRVKSTTVDLNGRQIGAINNPNFFDFLMRVLVGPVPVSVELKETIVSASLEATTVDNFINSRAQAGQAVAQSGTAEVPVTKPVAKPALSLKAPVKLNTPKIAAPATPRPTPTPAPKVAKARTPEVSAAAKTPAPQPAPVPTPSVTVAAVAESAEDARLAMAEPLDTVENIVARQTYYAAIVKKISRSIDKTKEASQVGKARLAKVVFRATVYVSRGGMVKRVELLNPSDKDDFNRAAEIAIRRAAPFGDVPSSIEGKELDITVPVPIDWVYVSELNREGLL